jgi:NAD(P)-dependent dehydrogenase (short-subunit alcohol dehydrogenase family)
MFPVINICSVSGKRATGGESCKFSVVICKVLFTMLKCTIFLDLDCAAKHGVMGFSHSMFEKVRDQGVKVSCICPGYVNTSMTKDVSDKANMIQPEAIAETVLFCIKVCGQEYDLSCKIDQFNAICYIQFPDSGCVTEIEVSESVKNNNQSFIYL